MSVCKKMRHSNDDEDSQKQRTKIDRTKRNDRHILASAYNF